MKAMLQGTPEFEMFKDYWQMVQDFYIPEPNNPSYWDALTDAIIRFRDKHKTRFARELALTFGYEMQARGAEMGEGGKE